MHDSAVLCCAFTSTLKQQELAEMKEIRFATIHTKNCMAEYGKNEKGVSEYIRGL
jgi:hypothetical protein